MGVGSSRSDSATVRGAKSSRRREEKRDESARGVVEIQSPHNVQTSSGEYYSNEYRRRLRRRQEKARRLALLSSATRRAAQTEPKGDVCPAAMSESVATIPHRVMMEAPPSQTAAGAAPRTRQAPRRSASHDPHSRRRETNLPRLRDVDSYALYHHGGMVANWGYSQPGHDLYQRESCSRDCGGDNFMAV